MLLTPYQRHKAEWIDCKRCPLYKGRRNVVLVRGKLPCEVLFVGEAPGINEDALGKPFVGPAGKMLDRIIVEAGGSVPSVRLAFTNIIACIPYDEDGKKVSEPPDIAVKKCLPRLEELMIMARPDYIIGVGVVASKQLQKDNHRKYEIRDITHPAAILRANPAQQGLLYQKAVVVLREVFGSLIPF